ncbi:hypothetical protein COHA_006941 [Chlorella ohadii]|uniref:Uncharacterized protein n=1 Tax=Chlorella ohadii TaxID=2649997 RepID=A0AAD5DMW2_9CHLO|nr:hypothetical protein COHA_006941 [Chlorella ohadii]
MCSRYLASCLYAAVIASLVSSSAAARQRGLTAVNTASGSAAALPLEPRPTTANCSELFFEQRVDQFDFNGDAPTWQQRYFLCPQFANGSGTAAPPILFLAGNEAAVPKAVNTSGLLWELARDLGSLLVFAEHRYYGKSIPVNGSDAAAMQYLTVDAALTDYVRLIQRIKEEYASPDSPVAVFGASYGAMLAAWLRARYPQVVTAALASSAPLRSILVDGQGWDPTTFWEVVTRAASPEGGAGPTCAPNVRAAFAALLNQSATEEGRALVEAQLGLCQGTMQGEEDAPLVALALMVGAFDTAAMASSPNESSYFTGDPEHPLPAWPMRAVCAEMEGELSGDEELLGALGRAAAVVTNVTQDVTCFTREAIYSMAMQSFFPSNGTTDMFFDMGAFNASFVDEFCRTQFGEAGPVPGFGVLPLRWGARAADFATASNIIFSNGLLDPWSSGGFLSNLSDSLVAVVIPEAGHHVDLYWPEPEDLPQYAVARRQEKELLTKWLAEAQSTAGQPGQAG